LNVRGDDGKYEVFAKHAPYMEKLSIDKNRVVLQDNKRNRIAEFAR